MLPGRTATSISASRARSARAQLQGLSLAIVVGPHRERERSRAAGGRGGVLGSELMIGNDGAGDTWDNDGGANSPDEKMKA